MISFTSLSGIFHIQFLLHYFFLIEQSSICICTHCNPALILLTAWLSISAHQQVSLKPLLHPVVRVYTHKCAANIVEKYKHSLVVG